MHIPRIVLGLSVVVAALGLNPSADCEERPSERTTTFPVSFAVAEENGDRVQSDVWLEAQLADAEALFATSGIHFTRVEDRPFPPISSRVETRENRDALAGASRAGLLNVDVVASLRDVDDEARFRKGVHWRVRGEPNAHFIILSAAAVPGVLAHELGHFFGNGHSRVPDNVMSYERTGGPVFFDAPQRRIIVGAAARLLRSGELLPRRFDSRGD